jgi:hypothetical protein
MTTQTPHSSSNFDLGQGRCSPSGQLYEADARLRALLGLPIPSPGLPSLLSLAADAQEARKLMDWLLEPNQPAALPLRLKPASLLAAGDALVLMRSTARKIEGNTSIDLLVQPLPHSLPPAASPSAPLPPPLPRTTTTSPQQPAPDHPLRLQRAEAIEQWVGGLAHDLNNQLMVLMSGTYILQNQHPDDAASQETLTDMLGALQHATNLTRYLQSTAQLDLTLQPSLPITQRLKDARKLMQRVLGGRIVLNLSIAEPLQPSGASISEGGFGLLLLTLAWATRCTLGVEASNTANTARTTTQDSTAPRVGGALSLRAESSPHGVRLVVTLQPLAPPSSANDASTLLDIPQLGARGLTLRGLCESLGVTVTSEQPCSLILLLPFPEGAAPPLQTPHTLDDALKGQGDVLLVMQSEDGRASVGRLLTRAGY